MLDRAWMRERWVLDVRLPSGPWHQSSDHRGFPTKRAALEAWGYLQHRAEVSGSVMRWRVRDRWTNDVVKETDKGDPKR